METILAAAISAFAAIVVCVISSNAQNKKILSELDKHNEVQNVKLEELAKTVDKHNKVIERVYKLEQADAREKEQIKHMEEDIHKLQNYHN